MAASLLPPGVYRQETFPQSPPRLVTGVPGFAGYASAVDGSRSVVLLRFEDLAQAGDPVGAARLIASGPYLAAAIKAFFDNGGERCHVACADAANSLEAGLSAALVTLDGIDEIDLIALPDAMSLDEAAIVRMQAQALKQCTARGNRVAVLDALPGATPARVQQQANDISANLGDVINGTLYYPWFSVEPGKLVPPSGAVCGIIARTDAAVGVYKAPANVEAAGAIDLGIDLDDATQATLNARGINCLRALPGRGIRIWGARTLSRDPQWRYLSVRRLFLTLNRWIDLNLDWVVFESNNASLWARVERDLTRHLNSLWRAGALLGDRPEAAFFVRCNAVNNPAASREAGLLITEIGLAATVPAEFIVVRVNLRAAVTEPA